jgi:hypothetical protein
VLVSENGQAMASASAAGLNHILSVGRPHPGTETVDTQTAAVFRLKCSFHISTSSKISGKLFVPLSRIERFIGQRQFIASP